MSKKTIQYLLENFDFLKQKSEIRNQVKILRELNFSSQAFHHRIDVILKFMCKNKRKEFISKNPYFILHVLSDGSIKIQTKKQNYTTKSNYHLESLLFFADDKSTEEQIYELQNVYNAPIKFVKKSPYMDIFTLFYNQYFSENNKLTLKEIYQYLMENNKMLIHNVSAFGSYRTVTFSGIYNDLTLTELFHYEKAFTVLNFPSFKNQKGNIVDPKYPVQILIKVE